ncbi:MAG TPA: phenylacetic acid degradation protein PaaD, partial [Pseudonocardia sp.]
MTDDTSEAVAASAADAMYRADAAGRGAGIRLLDVGPGRAVVGMTVQARHVNGHGICHGGYLF